MAYASAADVQDRLGREMTPEETTLVETRLADVERMILRRIPDLDDQIDSGDISEDDVIQVEAEAVLRLVRNPDGLISETDGNYTYMLSQAMASGRLEIRPEEWAALGYRPRMFSIGPNLDNMMSGR